MVAPRMAGGAPTPPAHHLVASYRYLCARGARKFLRPGLERCDLEQVAAIGLIKAARRYDAAKRTPFEAYAWLMIVGELMHHVRDHERAVRVPRRTLALERKVASARETLVARLGREPSDAEIGTELGVLAPAVAEARRARGTHRPLGLDDVAPFAGHANDAVDAEDRVLIGCAFERLGRVERRVIAGIYLAGLTQAQLAGALQLTPKRVSRIHLAALARMRRTWSGA